MKNFFFFLISGIAIFLSLSLSVHSSQPDVKGRIASFTTSVSSPLGEITNLNSNNGNIINITSNNIFVENINTNKINGIQYIKTDSLLTEAYLADNTNSHGWYLNGSASADLTAWIGGNDLSIGAGALTTGTNPLGDTVYNTFDGSTYLVNTSSDFAVTGNLTLDFWVYIPDITPTSTECLISRYNGSNGWLLSLSTAGVLGFYVGGTLQVSHDMSTMGGGNWFHIIISRDTTSTRTILLIDGIIRDSKEIVTAITAAGNLEIGSNNGGSYKVESGTRIWNIHIDTDTAYTPDQARLIYCPASMMICKKHPNGAVRIDGIPRVILIETISTVLSSGSATTITSSFVYPESAYYNIYVSGSFYLYGSITENTGFYYIYPKPDGTNSLSIKMMAISELYSNDRILDNTSAFLNLLRHKSHTPPKITHYQTWTGTATTVAAYSYFSIVAY